MSAGGKRGRGPSVETVEGPDGEPILVLVVVSLRKKRENQPPAHLGLSYFREER